MALYSVVVTTSVLRLLPPKLEVNVFLPMTTKSFRPTDVIIDVIYRILFYAAETNAFPPRAHLLYLQFAGANVTYVNC